MSRPLSETKQWSRRRGTIALAASSYILIGLSIVQGVVLVPLYLRHISEMLYGAWLASGSILSYLSLSDIGLNSVIMQKVGEAHGTGDLQRHSKYIGSGLATICLLSLLPILLGITFAPYVPRLFALPAEDVQPLVTSFIIASFIVSAQIVGYGFGAILVAWQRQMLHGIIWISSTVIGILATVVLLVTGYGLMALPLGGLIQFLLVLVLEGTFFWRIYQQILPGVRLSADWSTVVELLKPSSLLFLARGGNTLVRHSDNLLIGIFIDTRAVLIYALTKRAFEGLWMLVGHSAGAFAPALSHYFGELKQRTLEARGLTDMLIHVSGVTGLVLMGGYVIFNRAFMELWVGPSFYAGNLVVIFIGMYGCLSALSLAFYQIVFARGRMYTAALSSGAEAFLRLGLMAALGWWFGLPGVALAGVASLAASGFWILWHRYRLDFKVSWSYAFRSLLPLATIGAGVITIGLIFRQLAMPAAVLPFVYQGVCYMGIASLWVLLVDRRIRGLAADILRGRRLAFSDPS